MGLWSCYLALNEHYALYCGTVTASRLPQLKPDQVLKLKQLTVLTLAETNKVYFQYSASVCYCKMLEICLKFCEHLLLNWKGIFLMVEFGQSKMVWHKKGLHKFSD